MDKTINSKQPLSLEEILTSYNILIGVFILFLCLMVLMIKTNSKGFNKAFGYQIFITGPILLIFAILIKEIFVFNTNPQESWLRDLSISNHPKFKYMLIATIFCIGILGFFMMLYISGIFSNTPPENNSAMILNFVIILIFFAIAGFIYMKSKVRDEKILDTFPKEFKDIFDLRMKYTKILLFFIFIITLLYFVNPWGIMTNYGGPIVFFTLFIGIVCAILIFVYQRFLAKTGEAYDFKDVPSEIEIMLKGIYILVALVISGGLIYGALKIMGIFEQDASKPESWGHIIFNLILFCTMLGIIYKLANSGGFLDRNPFYRLILNTLLYIPCILITIPNYIISLFTKPGAASSSAAAAAEATSTKGFTSTFVFARPTPFELKMLGLSLWLLSSHFLWVLLIKPYINTQYLKQGGKQFINQPISTDVLTSVASYQALYDSDVIDYRYAISFWFYIDAFPPSTSSSYLKVVPILSYGDNPTVKYSSETNTLFVTVKQNVESAAENIQTEEIEMKPETIKKWKSVKDKISEAIEQVKTMSFETEVDTDGNRIIYTHPNVLLQKWNHVVLNYNGGTLDVFYNGELVKSEIQVVPYMKYDNLTVGTENGVKGNVANLMYFKMPLDILTINTLYTSLKDKNPPSISENPKTLIPIENN
jgi:uncharacterized membrane protein